MAVTLSDIRFLIERNVKKTIENEDVVNWCNYVNSDIGVNINVPGESAEISLTTTDYEYDLPADLKMIYRLRLQSWVDMDIDYELRNKYRIYNGKIIFHMPPWFAPDTLIVDYYKHMTYFTDITDEIDIEDRFAPLYTFYGIAAAKGQEPSIDPGYGNMKAQLLNYYSLKIEPTVVNERW